MLSAYATAIVVALSAAMGKSGISNPGASLLFASWKSSGGVVKACGRARVGACLWGGDGSTSARCGGGESSICGREGGRTI